VDAYAVECGQHNPTQVRTTASLILSRTARERREHLVRLPSHPQAVGQERLGGPCSYGEDGWAFFTEIAPATPRSSSRPVSGPATDGHGQPSDDGEWWHASMNRKDRLPDYRDMVPCK